MIFHLEVQYMCCNNKFLKELRTLKSNLLNSINDFQSEDSDNLPASTNDLSQTIKDKYHINHDTCPLCGSSNFVKNGKSRLGIQKFKCKDCIRNFSETTNSPMSYSKKPIEKWIEYMACMCEAETVRFSAQRTKLSISTSFQWRHKILNALKAKLNDNLNGIVEIDEVRINESFKDRYPCKSYVFSPFANKLQNPENNNSKISLLCCKDRNGHMFLQAASRQKVNVQDIDKLIGHKIPFGSVICARNNWAFNSFAKKYNLKLYRLRSHSESIKGIYSIADVTAMGRNFKKLIGKFRGVATKYMNFYASWFKSLEVIKEMQRNQALVEMYLNISASHSKLRVCDFRLVTSIPE